MIYFKIIRTKHNGKEGKDFSLTRPEGSGDYLFLHFKTPVMFRTGDRTSSELRRGACIILSPHMPHAFSPCGEELVHDWIHFLPDNEKEFFKMGIPINKIFYPSDNAFITSSVKICEQELIYREEFFEEIASSELNSLLIRLKRQLNDNSVSPHRSKLKALREAIYRNPGNYSGAEHMASEIGLSRTRFTVIYKEFFGISPNRDLIDARISRAAHLLTVGTLSLERIADDCGYQSIYHFIRQFRKEKGITPGEYKKRF